MADLYSACDLVAYSSMQPEPSGWATVEAMIAQTSAVATDVGGASEMGSSGKIVASRDAQPLGAGFFMAWLRCPKPNFPEEPGS